MITAAEKSNQVECSFILQPPTCVWRSGIQWKWMTFQGKFQVGLDRLWNTCIVDSYMSVMLCSCLTPCYPRRMQSWVNCWPPYRCWPYHDDVWKLWIDPFMWLPITVLTPCYPRRMQSWVNCWPPYRCWPYHDDVWKLRTAPTSNNRQSWVNCWPPYRCWPYHDDVWKLRTDPFMWLPITGLESARVAEWCTSSDFHCPGWFLYDVSLRAVLKKDLTLRRCRFATKSMSPCQHTC